MSVGGQVGIEELPERGAHHIEVVAADELGPLVLRSPATGTARAELCPARVGEQQHPRPAVARVRRAAARSRPLEQRRPTSDVDCFVIPR